MAIFLGARRAQPCEAVAIDRTLPGEEFIDRQHVAAACFFEREESAANSCNHFGLATNYPTYRPRWWEIVDCQTAAVGPADVFHLQRVARGDIGSERFRKDEDITAPTCIRLRLRLV